MAAVRKFTSAAVHAGLKQHNEPPSQVAYDVIASVTDAVLERLTADTNGDLIAAGIHAVVTAATDTAEQYDLNDEGLAVMAALD